MATVLVVDDNAPNRELVVTLLGHMGHRALEAADGAEALVTVWAERPELVVSDILMPTMDGYEFVRQLRADPAIAGTEVIFYTAFYHDLAARSLAKECGVSRVLSKPSEPDAIMEAIDAVLGNRTGQEPASVPRSFDDEHLRLITDKLSQKVAELEASNQRLAALTDLNLQLAEERDPQVLLAKFCRGARDLVGAKHAVLVVGVGDTGITRQVYTSGMDAALAARLGLPAMRDGLLGAAFEGRKAGRMTNPGGDPRALGLPVQHPPVHCMLVAPIVSLAHTYGWICLTDKLGVSEFSEDDERLLAIHAAQVGRVYENGSLYSALRDSQEGLRRAQVVAKLAHVVSLPDGEFESWSDTLPGLVGLEPGSMPHSNREWLSCMSGSDREAFREKLIEAARTQKGFDIEYRMRRPDGSWVDIRQVSEPLGANGGEDGSRWFGILQDVTAITTSKKSQEVLQEQALELTAANEELESFSYSVSHDLRAPLRGIDGFAQMLEEEYAHGMDQRAAEWLGRIRAASQRMSLLIDDLLSLSRVARREIRPVRTDLSAMAAAIFDEMREDEPLRKVEVVIAPGLVADTDPHLVRIALWNLLGNAWKFSARRDRARIEFGVRPGDGKREYFVKDDGAGFDMAFAGKLFGAFQRMHGDAEFAGTGIGLATVQRIVHRLGGTIRADAAPGKGATFFFTLGVGGGA